MSDVPEQSHPERAGRDGLGGLAGLLAIGAWSLSVAFSRDLAEGLGVLTSSALIYLPAGAIGTGWLAARGRLRPALAAPRAYLLGCGGLFVAYLVAFCLAIGFCRSGREVVEIGLINYLWPVLTLALSVPLLGHRARWGGLASGAALALVGVFLGALEEPHLSYGAIGDTLAALGRHLAENPAPYALALVAAVTWSLYSNLTRRLGGGESGAVPLFLLAAGSLLLLLRPLVEEHSTWTLTTGLQLGYMILLPGLLAYSCWERAMRSRHMVATAALAYLIPLFSTWITAARQDVPMGGSLWLACGLLVAGAWICAESVKPGKAAS